MVAIRLRHRYGRTARANRNDGYLHASGAYTPLELPGRFLDGILGRNCSWRFGSLGDLDRLTLCFAPEVLKPAILFKLFSLAVTVEFLSVLVLLEERAAIASLAGLSRPRAFAWVAHCALLIAAMYLVLAPMAPIHGTVGLSVAMMCFVSAADYVQDAAQRLKAAEWRKCDRLPIFDRREWPAGRCRMTMHRPGCLIRGGIVVKHNS